MTKEELDKEAEENSFRYTLDKPWICEVERKQIMAHFRKGYLAGAEPREKRIEELTEWLNEASDEKLKLQMLRVDLVSKIGNQEKRIEELEMTVGTLRTFSNEQATNIERLKKENAELKTDYKVLSCSVDDFGKLQDELEEEQRKNNGLSDNLTKAKELMLRFIELKNKPCAVGHSVNMLLYDNICTEVKQFLSEVEK